MKVLRWLVAVLLLTASLGQLNRLFIGDGSDVVLYANDILIGIMAVWYVATAIIARKSWRIPPVILPLFLWLMIGGLGLVLARSVLNFSEILISASYLLRYGAYAIVLFFVAYDSLVYASSWKERERTMYGWIAVLLVSALLMAVSGFIQLYVLPDLAVLAKYGWDPHVNRLVTAMLDPNYAGCYFSIAIGLSTSLFLHLKQHYILRLVLLLLTAILLLALLLTFSRSGYIMLAVVLGCIALVKSRSLLVVGLMVALLTVLYVPRVQTRLIGAIEIDASAQPRIVSWQNSLTIAQKNLFLGVGFNTYRYAQDRYGIISLDTSGNAGAGADSSWLFILATTGLLGLLVFVANYIGLIWSGWQVYRASEHEVIKASALGLLAVLCGLAVASQFNNALFYTWILEPLWLWCGLVVGMGAILGKNEVEV
jgi:O-antigen ligase